tara:strand:- start:198 stop:593 length:396 start_codon:yes stop_codon:yes gene_type:complete
MIHIVRARLLENQNLLNLVPANDIFLVKARQGHDRPYVVIDLEETQVERNTDGVHGETYHVLVYITSESISEAWSIQTEVKRYLSEFDGQVTVDGITYDFGQTSLMDIMTDAHELHDFYIIGMSFNIIMGL